MASAISLARAARSVIVLERTRYERQRPGETFVGEFGPLSQTAGAMEPIAALEAVPFRGVRAAWGGPAVADRESIFHPFGEGWQVDRVRFDQALVSRAERCGVVVAQGTGACPFVLDNGVWTVRPAAGGEVKSRDLIDASGRGASAGVAHMPGRRWLRADRLVAIVGSMTHQPRESSPCSCLRQRRTAGGTRCPSRWATCWQFW